MKKQIFDERDSFTGILPDYGRRKLLTYADSIRELAESFRENKPEEISDKESREVDRRDYVWQKRLLENKNLMVEHLQEMSGRNMSTLTQKS